MFFEQPLERIMKTCKKQLLRHTAGGFGKISNEPNNNVANEPIIKRIPDESEGTTSSMSQKFSPQPRAHQRKRNENKRGENVENYMLRFAKCCRICSTPEPRIIDPFEIEHKKTRHDQKSTNRKC